MPRGSPIQNQFTRGEMSPLMTGRNDLEQYYQGAKTMVNCLPLSHGGAVGRPGTMFVGETQTSSETCRIIEFIFNTSDSYAIELGDQYARFYRNRGRVLEADKTVTNISQANPAVVTSTSHGYSNGDHVIISGVSGMTEVNGRRFTVANQTANTFELSGVDSTSYTAYSSAGVAGKVYQIATPWAEADLFEIKFVQDADTMYLVHPSYKPRELSRSGHTSWTVSNYAPTGDPFTGANDYPAAVAFFEQRIVFGYSNNAPQKLWFSQSGNIQDMTTGTGDSDGFTKTLFATRANPIRWIVGGSDLIVGTTGGAWVVDKPASSAVTVSNFSIKRREASGVANRQPAEVDSRILFLARRGQASNMGRKLRDFQYDEDNGKYTAPDLTLLSHHVTGTGTSTAIQEMAWQDDGWNGSYQSVDIPGVDRVLWCIRTDGVLATLTFNPDELVIAWAQQVSSGFFESVAVIPGADGDEVWCVVKRTINGSTVRHIEYFHPDVFLDACLIGTEGSPKTTWWGLDHLEGETVTILADGSPVGTKTVSGGSITLDTAASWIQVGLPFTPEIELMPLEMGMQDGTSIGAAKSVARVAIRFLNTVGIKVTGSERTAGFEIPFREVSDNVEDPIPPFIGTKEFPPPASWVDETLKITQENPLPFCLLAVVMEMETHR